MPRGLAAAVVRGGRVEGRDLRPPRRARPVPVAGLTRRGVPDGGERLPRAVGGDRQAGRARVDAAAVVEDLVEEVRPGREARRADRADHLALADVGADAQARPDAGEVSVAGAKPARVAEPDVAAVVAVPAKHLDRPGLARLDGGAGGGRRGPPPFGPGPGPGRGRP